MNIIDAVLIILFIVGILGGIKRGFIKEVILLVGIILVVVLAFYLKNPLATLFYKYVPFINFWGLFKGLTVLNILFYEFIAFIIALVILTALLNIILKASGIIEKIFEITIVFGLLSKILGAIVGFITSYVLIFVMLFILNQPFFNINGIDNSKISKFMINNTPFIGNTLKKTINSMNEIKELKAIITSSTSKDELNYKALNIMLDNEIISIDNLKLLKENGKLKFSGINELIGIYGG